MFNKLFEILVWMANKLPHFVTIPPDEQAVILRFGKYLKTLGEGGHYYFHWPVIHTVMQIVSTRQLVDIDKQDVLTSDGYSVCLNASVEYVITDPKKALLHVEDYDKMIQEVAGDAFRAEIGNYPLTALEAGKVAAHVANRLMYCADKYGTQVTDVYVPTFTRGRTIRLIQE